MNAKNYRIKIKQGFLFPILMLFVISPACSSEREQNWESIKNDLYNFQIIYPTKWIAETHDESGWKGDEEIKLTILQRTPAFGLSSMPSAFSIIIKQRFFEKPEIDDVLTWANESLDSNSSENGLQVPEGYQEYNFEKINVDSYEALRRRYTYSSIEGIKIEEILIPRQSDMLIITYRIDEDFFNENYDDFQKIYISFQAIKSE